jgi:hypothetical protein
VYSRGGIGWVIIDSDFNESGLVLSNVAKENPQLFQLAHASPSGRIVVYRYLGRQ